MNLVLPIVISLAAAAVVALLAVLFAKKTAAGKAVLVMLFVSASVLTGSTLAYAESEATAPTAPLIEANYTAPEAKSLTMAYALLYTGDSEAAKNLLNEYEQTTVYSGDYALCRARIAALEEKYTAAKLLYEKSGTSLTSGSVKDEYTTVCSCLADSGIDSAIYGVSEDYSSSVEGAEALIQEAKQARAQLGDLIRGSIENILGKNKTQDYEQAVALIKEVDSLYESYLQNTYYFDTTRAAELFEEAEALTKKDDIAATDLFRLARIKLFILLQDFEGFALSLDQNSDYHELLVIAELYINGYIDEESFSTKYGKDRIAIYEKIYDHLDECKENYSKELRKMAADFLEEMDERMDHAALTAMEDTLLSYANDTSVDDRTKIYLQLAKYELFNGDEVKTNQHLTDALNMVTDCKDPVYMDAMCELITIINDKDNPESMKNIANYVNDVSKNSTTVKLAENLMQKNPEIDTDEEEKEDVSFENYISDYVSKKRTSLNILSVDTSQFPNVSFNLGVDSEIAYTAEELKALLSVSDCGVDISNFTVEDITYSNVNMVLVCDTSGSMSGSPINDLKSAVTMFINNKAENEHIGLITFHSSVSGVYGLDTSVSELNSVVEKIYASGGTNIYSAMVAATGLMTGREDALNVIILLSDGQAYHNQKDVDMNVIAPCLANNTLIYSLGLGSGVDAECLDSYASPTGGSYLHIVNSATLSSFYEYLHSMVLNRYKVTFTVQDTLHYSRTLRVESKEDALAYDTFKYKIGEDGSEEESGSGSSIVYHDKYVMGLSAKFLYDTDKDQILYLQGKGFEQSDVIEVTLNGKLKYTLKVSYVSDNKYQVTIPANILNGTYDMEVSLNGMIGVFPKEITVGDEIQTTKFGPYKFTSFTKETKGSVTTLDGYVCMNGWLCFKGSIELHGVLEGERNIRLVDNSGSYVKFDIDATGLAKQFVASNKSFELDPLQSIYLYNTDEDPTEIDYSVDTKSFKIVTVEDVLEAQNPQVSLYPGFLRVRYEKFTTKFPFQKQILKNVAGMNNLFSFSYSNDLLVSAKNMGTRIEMGYGESGENRNYQYANLGNMKIGISPNDTKVVVDTYNGIYDLKFVAKFDFLNLDGLGLELEWTDSLGMKKVWVNIDQEIQTNISGVPISFSNFWLGADDIDNSQPFILWTLTGQMDIEVADVTEVVPELDKYMKETPVMAFEETGITFAFGKGYMKLSTKASLLGEIDLGSLEITAGKITYTNVMLDMYNESASGLLANLSIDVSFDLAKVKGSLNGDGQISLTNRFFGLSASGDVEMAVNLWIAEPKISLEGNALIGVVTESDGDVLFTIRTRRSAGIFGTSFRLDIGRRHDPVIVSYKII